MVALTLKMIQLRGEKNYRLHFPVELLSLLLFLRLV